MKNIVIKFKDKQLNNKDIFNILDLQAQIEKTVQVFAVAEAISSDNKIDNFMINQSSSGLHNDLIYRFGKRIKVVSITHNSPTLLIIVVSYRVANMIFKYFDKENPPTDFIDIDIHNRNINKRLLADFITSLELLREIIEEITEG